METIRLLYPDWLVIGVFAFLVLATIAICCFIFVSIKFVEYLCAALESNQEFPSILYIKDLDGDNIINVAEIEQITQRYNSENKEYEIVYYLKSGHELKETFDYNNSGNCRERFDDIYNILNDFNC